MNERTISLIGEDKLNLIREKRILLVGLGGVGASALEALARSGIEHFTICDGDIVEESNLNRQILATHKTLGKRKVNAAFMRLQDINPNIELKALDFFLDDHTIFFLDNYDYIIDACDTVDAKVELINYALRKNIKVISCMGTGKRLDPQKLKISTLDKTYNDPLAKVMRSKVKENIPVVFSEELPLNKEKTIGSMAFVPETAGILLAYYVINDIINN